MLTSQYTFLAPLRFHIYRCVRMKAAELGYLADLHEEQVLRLPSSTSRAGETKPVASGRGVQKLQIR
jgi:hypothetical protein